MNREEGFKYLENRPGDRASASPHTTQGVGVILPILQPCLLHDTQWTNSQPFAFKMFLFLLFLFYQSYKKLVKITTNNFSFPQVQVINSSQKPTKLLMDRYIEAIITIQFVTLSSHASSVYYMDIDETLIQI